MRPLQTITICTHWSLAFCGTSEDEASFTRSSNIDNPKSTNQTPQPRHIDHLITQPRPEPCSIVVVRFSWVVLHVPIKSYHLVNKVQIEVWLGSLAFLQRKATLTALHCSSAFAHLELLIFNLQTAILLLEAINEQPYKSNKKIHLRTIQQNKRKTLKESTKGQGLLLRLRERKKHRKRN